MPHLSRLGYPTSHPSFAPNLCFFRPRQLTISSVKTARVLCQDQACLQTSNQTARAVYLTVQAIAKYFFDRFRLFGLDQTGELPEVKVHWDEENAFWTCQAGSCFWQFHDSFALQPEIVAHEYAHGIIQFQSNLGNVEEAGALNESISDVFGLIFKRAVLCEQGWNIGHLRDASVHADMSNYADVLYPSQRNDWGYVHHNSRIPTHAFFTAACLSQTPIDGALARIWFLAMKRTQRNETFESFALKTLQVSNVYATPRMTRAIAQAWHHVGVKTHCEIPSSSKNPSY